MPIKGRAELIAYLMHKVDMCDWHAVRDACVDLEILEARQLQVPVTSVSVTTNRTRLRPPVTMGKTIE